MYIIEYSNKLGELSGLHQCPALGYIVTDLDNPHLQSNKQRNNVQEKLHQIMNFPLGRL